MTALAIVVLPFGLEAKVGDALLQLMSGACEALREDGCALVGGHTCEGAEMSLGFAINGVAPRGSARDSEGGGEGGGEESGGERSSAAAQGNGDSPSRQIDTPRHSAHTHRAPGGVAFLGALVVAQASLLGADRPAQSQSTDCATS